VLSLRARSPLLANLATAGLGLIAVLLGEPETARRLYATLAGQRGTASFFVPLTIDRLLGSLAVTSGRVEDALVHFADGLAFCGRAGYRTEYAWTAADYADALVAGPGTEGEAKALELHAEALEIASDLGMKPLVERVLARRELLEAESA
jgi:hypothetical protein